MMTIISTIKFIKIITHCSDKAENKIIQIFTEFHNLREGRQPKHCYYCIKQISIAQIQPTRNFEQFIKLKPSYARLKIFRNVVK